MIVSRTPFRITLAGGGTDLPAFYEKHGGEVLALGIDKYMYVVVNVPMADRLVRLHYTKSEVVANSADLQHELAREALLAHGIRDAFEISSVADLPAGTGLGSSSCYLVGLLAAIRAYLSRPVSLQELAEEACRIELDVLRKPIGKQDQYMASFGGLTQMQIDHQGQVSVRTVDIAPHAISELVANTHLYYTGVQRTTTDILGQQTIAVRSQSASSTEQGLVAIRHIGKEITNAILECDFDRFGTLMHEHWVAKKQLSPGVTIGQVEDLYEHVRRHYNVLGGKIAGAGGGGFLMLYCPAGGLRLTEFMAQRGMPRLYYGPEFEGSRVIANIRNAPALHGH